MKKVIFLMLGIVAMFASCSQSEELLTEGNNAKEVTFSLTADSQVQTRATGSLRYLMAIYDETGENEVVATTEFGSSTFAVRLDPGKYTCLFWADYGSSNYDASDLKSVVLQDAATEVEAFYAKQGITVTDGGTVNVTLSRAVAKVVLKETDRLEAGSIKVSYDGFKGFDVSQQAGILPATLTQTLPIASVLTGSATAPTEVGSFLLLANPDERVLSDFRVQYNGEAEKTVTNVPVQANYVTNINGKFSVNVAQQFSITIDDIWATPEKIVQKKIVMTIDKQNSWDNIYIYAWDSSDNKPFGDWPGTLVEGNTVTFPQTYTNTDINYILSTVIASGITVQTKHQTQNLSDNFIFTLPAEPVANIIVSNCPDWATDIHIWGDNATVWPGEPLSSHEVYSYKYWNRFPLDNTDGFLLHGNGSQTKDLNIYISNVVKKNGCYYYYYQDSDKK